MQSNFSHGMPQRPIIQGPIFHPTEPCIFALSAAAYLWRDEKESKSGRKNNAATRAAREDDGLRGMRENDDPV